MKLRHQITITSGIVLLAGLLILLTATPAERAVLSPMVAASWIVFLLVYLLWTKEHRAPFFDLGVMCALATLVYMLVPLIGYLAAGLRFSADGDFRMFQYQPSPAKLGRFHWRHVVYLACLCASYWLIRRKSPPLSPTVRRPNRSTTQTIILVFVALLAYFWLLKLVTGFTYQQSYEDMRAAYGTPEQEKLPRVIAQISHYILGWYILFKLAVMLLVVQRSNTLKWLLVLVAWMAIEIALSFFTLGARTWTVILVVGAVISYHRIVRPLPMRWVVPIAGVFMYGFLVFGLVRSPTRSAQADVLEAGNEFQILLGTAWDVNERHKSGSLDIPWQVYAHDFIKALPPQQIVPFRKIDGSLWYIELTDPGIRGRRPTGKMWGVMSQQAIGFGYLELIVRGLLLGAVLAWLHRLYARSSDDFTATLLYLWLCLKIYNTFRDGTFTLITNVIYEAIPVMLLLRFLPRTLKRIR